MPRKRPWRKKGLFLLKTEIGEKERKGKQNGRKHAVG